MNKDYEIFIKECIKNRNYLELSYKDMSNCLIDVTPSQYCDFENGNYSMSRENIERIINVLCLKKSTNKSYIENISNIDELDEEEIKDIVKIMNVIEGDNNA